MELQLLSDLPVNSSRLALSVHTVTLQLHVARSFIPPSTLNSLVFLSASAAFCLPLSLSLFSLTVSLPDSHLCMVSASSVSLSLILCAWLVLPLSRLLSLSRTLSCSLSLALSLHFNIPQYFVQ